MTTRSARESRVAYLRRSKGTALPALVRRRAPLVVFLDLALDLTVAVIFPFLPVIFLMGQDMDDVDPLLIVPDLRDEAVLVASNVEDGTISNRIGVREIEPRLDQVRPPGVFGDPIPIFERLFGVGMNFPKLAQSFPADDSHQYSSSKVMLPS